MNNSYTCMYTSPTDSMIISARKLASLADRYFLTDDYTFHIKCQFLAAGVHDF